MLKMKIDSEKKIENINRSAANSPLLAPKIANTPIAKTKSTHEQ